MPNQIQFLCITLLFLVKNVDVLENGLARTPPMGWMSWGYYECGNKCKTSPEKCLNEELIMSVADTFFKEGYQEAGYEYIIVDDCWSEMTRDSNDLLVADTERFPRGMKFLADYIHNRGLKFGMYTNVASVTCMHYPGSKHFFETDARTFAEWGADYLKVDGCFVSEHELNTAYIELGRQLNKTGRPIVFSCSWPYYIEWIHKHVPDYSKIREHCNLWRNYHDVQKSWSAVKYIINYYEIEYRNLSAYHGPGHWNDPDMLILGTNVLTEGQSKVQMSVYAMLSAPLLISCNMHNIVDFEKKLLQNLDLIAIAQDPLGVMAAPYTLIPPITLWVKHHLPMKGNKYHSVSFLLVNLERKEYSVSFTPGDYGLDYKDYTVMDIYTGVFLRNITNKESILVTVPPEDCIMYTLYPL